MIIFISFYSIKYTFITIRVNYITKKILVQVTHILYVRSYRVSQVYVGTNVYNSSVKMSYDFLLVILAFYVA
jgi:hypothetical protein